MSHLLGSRVAVVIPGSAARALVSRRGLYEFVKLAWPIVEPNAAYVDGWHIKEITYELSAVSRGETRRLILNQPPGTSKSLLTGVFWPAWDWIENPWRKWFYASYDEGLVTRDAGKLLELVRSSWYVETFGARVRSGPVALTDFSTIAGGGRFSTSFGSRGTGRHAHIQVIDDPIKPKDASGGSAVTGVMLDKTWATFSHTFASRAVDPETFARVLVMQRIHEDDPTGRALAQGGWRHVKIPMLCEAEDKYERDPRAEGETLGPRWTQETVETLKRDMGPDVFETQEQQRPTVPGGQIIHEEWIDPFVVSPGFAKNLIGMRVQSWDLTFKDAEHSDNVAGGWWLSTLQDGEMHFYELDDPLDKILSFVDTCHAIESRAKLWPSSEILIEDKANGPAAESMLRSKIRNLRLVNPQGSKVGRGHAVAPLWAAGRVHMVGTFGPDGKPIPGSAFEKRRATYLKFPRVRRDDVFDQMTQALLRLSSMPPYAAAMAELKKDLAK